MGFASFMASGFGRGLRIVAGLVLLAVGLLVVQGLSGILIAVVALVPLLAGIFDVCVFAPLFRAPFKGSAVRDHSDRIAS